MYHFLTYFFSISLAIFTYSFWTMERDYPFGIDLGPEYLTAAFVNQNGNIVQAVKHEMTQMWKDFYLDTLQVERTRSEMEQHAGTEQYKEFVRTVYLDVREAVEAAMGRPVLISHITYPQHLKGLPYLTPLYYTPYKTYPEITNFLQIGPYLDCVRYAYGLSTAEALGYDAGTDLSWENPLLVHVDYQRSYLEVSIMSVAEDVDSRERMFRIDGFGGSEYRATQAEIEDFTNRFKDIIDEQIRDNRYVQTQPKDFRFIILSGGAPPSEFDKTRAAICKLFPEFAHRFLSEVDPLWTGAEGAARQAKRHVLDPPGSFVDAPW